MCVAGLLIDGGMDSVDTHVDRERVEFHVENKFQGGFDSRIRWEKILLHVINIQSCIII